MMLRERAPQNWRWRLFLFVALTILTKQCQCKVEDEIDGETCSTSGQHLRENAKCAREDLGASSEVDFTCTEPGDPGDTSWKMWHQPLETETVQTWELDISGIVGHDVTFSILQKMQTYVEFYTLPSAASGDNLVEVTLLAKGRNSATERSPPDIHLEVTALESGPAVHIRVEDSNDGYSPVLLSVLVLALVTVVSLVTATKFWLPFSTLETKRQSERGQRERGGRPEQEVPASTITATAEGTETAASKNTSAENGALLAEDCQPCRPSLSANNPDAEGRHEGMVPSGRQHAVSQCALPTMTTRPAVVSPCTEQMKPAHECPDHASNTDITSSPRHQRPLSSPVASFPHRVLRRLLLLSLLLAALTAVAVGVSSLKTEYTLQIGVPSSKHIRKVRMFTEHPELKEIARSSSSLSLISRLQLIDLRSCHGNLSECETVALCDGGDNDLVCRCRRGYYFQDHTCKECSKSCQDGHYLVTQCSADADAVCKPCTVCSGSQYQAAVCTSTRDTICVDVTFPVGILPWNTSQEYDDGTPINVSHSGNIFMERLVDMKELETPMYVTNNQQSMNFVWNRNSGMDITIWVSGVFLLPEYRELDVSDDSDFYKRTGKLTESEETMRKFEDILSDYCKHPMPDYYDLILQITPNRTSAAQVVRCDSQDATVPECPKSYKDGDRYLKWDINKKCEKYADAGGGAQSLSPIQALSNDVVCMDETGLDTKVFRLPRHATNEMMFPSVQCLGNQSKCNECLMTSSCSNANDDPSCCGLPCYSQPACLEAFNPKCPPAQVECGQGDVRVFTLQPVFSNIAQEFNCYMTYQLPEHLYNITYSLSIPSIGFAIPVQKYTAIVRSREEHRHRVDTFDFIRLWHDTQLPVTEDLIMNGKLQELETIVDSTQMKPFVIRPLKENHEFSQPRRGFRVKRRSRTEYTTTVQFERPFTYSSASWSMGGCDKNMSQIFPGQTVYKKEEINVLAKKREEAFAYQMYQPDKYPYIKFSVAEGTSVLRWFQGKYTSGTINAEQLSGALSWNMVKQQWTINISGAVRNCPAIFTLQIFNKMMSSCIGIYDILASCPENFNLTLSFSRTDDRLPDIFVVFLNDSEASHRMVLSSVIAPVDVSSARASATSVTSKTARADVEVWTPVFAVVVLFFLGIFIVFIVYLYIKFKSMNSAVDEGQTTTPAEMPALNNQASGVNSMGQRPADIKHKPPRSARTCLCVFIVLYLFYSVIFTFSVILVILYFTHLSIMGNVSGVTNYTIQLQSELNTSFNKVQVHEKEEEMRLFQAVESRFQACSHHLQQQNRIFLQNYHDTVTQFLTQVFQKGGIVQSLTGDSVLENTSVYTKEIQQFIVDCNKTIQSVLERFESHFSIYAKEVMGNPWFDFPREVFLQQEGDPPDRKYMSSNQMARFLHWLQVDKTDELLHVTDSMTAGLAELEVPSATEYLKESILFADRDFSSSLPAEPMVARHTVLLLDRPDRASSLPGFYTDTPSSTPVSNPSAAFPDSGKSSKELGEVVGNFVPETDRNESERVTAEPAAGDVSSLFLYILIGLFVLIDVLLFVYRMSWMVTQVRAAKDGYEDRIPTDIVSQKILAIQTGYHMGRMSDMYEAYSYPADNKDNVITAEERASEGEFNVYFCQSYPKSKDDILREIMAQKMSSQERSLGGDEPVVRGQGRQPGRRQKLGVVQECGSCCRWLHRMLISPLVWRFVLTAVLLLFLCLFAYAADFWLTADNLQGLVGGQSAARDLHHQVHMTNHHLARTADHLSFMLGEQKVAVDTEISLSTALLSSTLDAQRLLLLSVLESMCQGASTPACNASMHSYLPSVSLPTWQGCNFLPVQPQLHDDLSTQHLDRMLAGQLSPLLELVKHWVFSMCAVVMAALCVMFLCHASASVARYYMIIWGRLPRIQIYQISENTSLLYDGGPSSQKPMQRSASWLESCESGVYVGENEDTNMNRDV